MYLWSCVKQDIEQFRYHTLFFNCYLDRILFLSNCIGPKARALASVIYNLYDNAYIPSQQSAIYILRKLRMSIHEL